MGTKVRGATVIFTQNGKLAQEWEVGKKMEIGKEKQEVGKEKGTLNLGHKKLEGPAPVVAYSPP